MVLGSFSWLCPPNDEDDPTYDWNQADEPVPAALVDVVQTANAQTQLRQQDGKAPNAGKDGAYLTEQAENQAYDEIEQEEPPELGASGTAFEVDVVFQDDALDDGDDVFEIHDALVLEVNALQI